MPDFSSILIHAAELAAEVMLSAEREPMSKFGADSAADIVTKADKAVETALRDFFSKKLPGYNILGEEFGGTYDGNGKVIHLDPIDDTKGFVERRPTFGTIIGVYHRGTNVAGIEYNASLKSYCVATEEDGFHWVGNSVKEPADTIYIAPHNIEDARVMKNLVQETRKEFPGYRILHQATDYDVLAKCKVFRGAWALHFEPSWSRHDIAAAPLFGRLTGTLVTDHRGARYDDYDATLEAKKYATGRKDVIYSLPVLVAKPELHARFLRLLDPFVHDFDKVRNKGYL